MGQSEGRKNAASAASSSELARKTLAMHRVDVRRGWQQRCSGMHGQHRLGVPMGYFRLRQTLLRKCRRPRVLLPRHTSETQNGRQPMKAAIAAVTIGLLAAACSSNSQPETIAPAADVSEPAIAAIPAETSVAPTSKPAPTITTPSGRTINLLPTEQTKTDLRTAINRYEAREAWCATRARRCVRNNSVWKLANHARLEGDRFRSR